MEENTKQPDNKNNSGADASYVADDVYLHLVKKYEQKLEQNPDYDDNLDYEDDEPEDEICGYYCLCCGHTQEDDFECEVCMSNALDPIYF